MKAITLYEPYATLVALEQKKFETRPWSTRYRGPLAIHAAKAIPGWAKDTLRTNRCRAVLAGCGVRIGPLARPENWLPLGKVVAVCELVECIALLPPGHHWLDPRYAVEYARTCALYGIPPTKDTDEFAFGDYSGGRFVWVLANVRRLREPIPARGLQRLWEWDAPPAVLALLGEPDVRLCRQSQEPL